MGRVNSVSEEFRAEARKFLKIKRKSSFRWLDGGDLKCDCCHAPKVGILDNTKRILLPPDYIMCTECYCVERFRQGTPDFAMNALPHTDCEFIKVKSCKEG